MVIDPVDNKKNIGDRVWLAHIRFELPSAADSPLESGGPSFRNRIRSYYNFLTPYRCSYLKILYFK